MPIKTYRPTTPTRRFQTVVSRDDITKDRPEKSLVESKKRTGGRSSNGRTTSRFIGGGSKKAYRLVVSRDDITKDRPEKSLVESKKRTGGRSSNGRTTSRFIGGGSKKAYRMVD